MNKTTKQKNVLVWGAFDLLHKGHIAFLRKSSQFGNLHVIIIPDWIIIQNKKRKPIETAIIRKLKIQQLSIVKKAYIDCIENGLTCLDDFNPEIICFGYDQDKLWEKILLSQLKKRNLSPKIIRLKKYAQGVHTKNLLKYFTQH